MSCKRYGHVRVSRQPHELLWRCLLKPDRRTRHLSERSWQGQTLLKSSTPETRIVLSIMMLNPVVKVADFASLSYTAVGVFACISIHVMHHSTI